MFSSAQVGCCRWKIMLFTEVNITFFHISTTLAAYASMWMYLCLWSWLILAPGLNKDCMKRSRNAGTRIWEENERFIRAWESREVTKNGVFTSDVPCIEQGNTFSFKSTLNSFLNKHRLLTERKKEKNGKVTDHIAKVSKSCLLLPKPTLEQNSAVWNVKYTI